MTFWDVLLILINFAGALALFLFGMKLMSEGLQKIAGGRMRNILGKITDNPFKGILAGTVVTAAIQSSSATTVMVVSFVNAGLLSLAGAISVIMGANIGTTVTAWIITIFSLGEGGGAFSFPMLAMTLSLLFMFSKRNQMKSIGEFIIGFAILLLGMEFLQKPMANLDQYPGFLHFLSTLSGFGFWSVLIFVLIGALLTCVVQASAAMMAITLVMCYNGWITFDVAVALVMGQNIGTTITANLAAMVANSMAKKAARAHLLFNVVGVVLTLIIFRPTMILIDHLTIFVTGTSPYDADASVAATVVPLALSFFHTFFNVVNTLIMVWFIPLIIKAVNRMVKPSAEDSEDEFRLTYISGGFMNTAELNIQAAKKEVEIFSERVLKMFTFLPALRVVKDEDEFMNIFHRIEKYEAITDHMELEIANFLTKISEGDLSKEATERVGSMLRIIDNLESIGDEIYQIAILRKNKRNDAVHFDQTMNDNLAHMTDLVQHALDVMNGNLHADDYSNINIEEVYSSEAAINEYRNKLRDKHFNDLNHGVYDYAVGTAYSGLYSLYEKLGDYVINVSEAIDNSRKVANNEEELAEKKKLSQKIEE